MTDRSIIYNLAMDTMVTTSDETSLSLNIILKSSI